MFFLFMSEIMARYKRRVRRLAAAASCGIGRHAAGLCHASYVASCRKPSHKASHVAAVSKRTTKRGLAARFGCAGGLPLAVCSSPHPLAAGIPGGFWGGEGAEAAACCHTKQLPQDVAAGQATCWKRWLGATRRHAVWLRRRHRQSAAAGKPSQAIRLPPSCRCAPARCLRHRVRERYEALHVATDSACS